MSPNAWAIDCNGLNFDAATLFSKSSAQICGIQACGFIGKASHAFNGFVKTRLRDEMGGTVLCGDPEEHVRAGAGKKWVFWDSDRYREMVQKAFVAELGSPGSLTLYAGDAEEHAEYARQICAEKLRTVRHRPDGRSEYFWKSAGDHDMLDSTAQAFACAAQAGLSPVGGPRRVRFQPRRRIRIV